VFNQVSLFLRRSLAFILSQSTLPLPPLSLGSDDTTLAALSLDTHPVLAFSDAMPYAIRRCRVGGRGIWILFHGLRHAKLELLSGGVLDDRHLQSVWILEACLEVDNLEINGGTGPGLSRCLARYERCHVCLLSNHQSVICTSCVFLAVQFGLAGKSHVEALSQQHAKIREPKNTFPHTRHKIWKTD
jgi:hypothetical protein